MGKGLIAPPLNGLLLSLDVRASPLAVSITIPGNPSTADGFSVRQFRSTIRRSSGLHKPTKKGWTSLPTPLEV